MNTDCQIQYTAVSVLYILLLSFLIFQRYLCYNKISKLHTKVNRNCPIKGKNMKWKEETGVGSCFTSK